MDTILEFNRPSFFMIQDSEKMDGPCILLTNKRLLFGSYNDGKIAMLTKKVLTDETYMQHYLKNDMLVRLNCFPDSKCVTIHCDRFYAEVSKFDNEDFFVGTFISKDGIFDG